MLEDRTAKKVVTHRLSVGRPARKGVRGSHAEALDHFEITGVEPDKDGQFPLDREAMERVAAMGPQYGTWDKLKRIPIRLDSDATDDSLVQHYRCRKSMPAFDAAGQPMMTQAPGDDVPSQLHRLQVWCEGNGKTAMRMTKDGTDKVEIPCRSSPKFQSFTREELDNIVTGKLRIDPRVDEHRCPYASLSTFEVNRSGTEAMKKSPNCKPETTLLSRCDATASIGVFARTRSHGHNTADRIRSTLDEIKARMPGGILADVPLDLVVMMVRPSAGSRLLPVLHVELRLSADDTVRLIESTMERRFKLEASAQETRRLLAAARAEVEAEDVIEAGFTAGSEGGGGLKVLP